MEEIKKIIGHWIKKTRVKKLKTFQELFVCSSGLGKTYLARVEFRKRNSFVNALTTIFKKTEVSLEVFFDR